MTVESWEEFQTWPALSTGGCWLLSRMSHDSEALRGRRATGIIIYFNGISVQNLLRERFTFSVWGGGGQGTVFLCGAFRSFFQNRYPHIRKISDIFERWGIQDYSLTKCNSRFVSFRRSIPVRQCWKSDVLLSLAQADKRGLEGSRSLA